VGSTPTRSIYFILVNYGIEMNSFSLIVGQIQQARPRIYLPH
jgi:hypothetical protein